MPKPFEGVILYLLSFDSPSSEHGKERETIGGSTKLFPQKQPILTQYKSGKHNENQRLSASESTISSLKVGPSLSRRLQAVRRKYLKQKRRSLGKKAANLKDDNDVTDSKVPYHTIIIDCAPITFVDSMGIKALYQVIAYTLQRIHLISYLPLTIHFVANYVY